MGKVEGVQLETDEPGGWTRTAGGARERARARGRAGEGEGEVSGQRAGTGGRN